MKVYKFYLRPMGDMSAVHQQMRHAHRYYNTLVELENRRRELFRCTKDTPTKKEDQEAIKLAHNEAVKIARGQTQCYSGTYLLIEEAVRRACSDTHISEDVKFRRYQRKGSIGIHPQKVKGKAPLVGETYTGMSTLMRIGNITSLSHQTKDYRQLSFRIGTVEGKQTPIWAEFSVFIDRPLPLHAELKPTAIHWDGKQRDEWYICITVGDEGSLLPNEEVIVGINEGWRKVPEGLRVATTSTGEHLILPNSIINRRRKADDLASIRKQKFNELYKKCVEHFGYDPQWKSIRRLSDFANLWHHWSAMASLCHTNSDNGLSDELWQWRKQEIHLCQYQEGLIRSFQNARQNLYRHWAKKFSQMTVVFGKFDKREVAEDPEIHAVSSNRFLASTSELTQCFYNKEKVSAADITHTCYACGTVDDFDAAKELEHTCSGCGERWDQDTNAAKVLCERYRHAQTTGSARSEKTTEKGGAWSKRKAKKGEQASLIEVPLAEIAVSA